MATLVSKVDMAQHTFKIVSWDAINLLITFTIDASPNIYTVAISSGISDDLTIKMLINKAAKEILTQQALTAAANSLIGTSFSGVN